MQKLNEMKYNAFKAFAAIWSKVTTVEPVKVSTDNQENNIFELARGISERAYSRRRLRRASSIF